MQTSQPPVWEIVSFDHYIDPYVQLLVNGSSQILLLALIVLNYASSVAAIAQVVFSRLIYRPFFDPLDPAFKNQILAQDESLVPELESRVKELNLKFKLHHLLRHDLVFLGDVNKEISETLKRLDQYLSILQSRHNRLQDVEDDITKIRDRYKGLDDQLIQIYEGKGEAILKSFKDVLQTFVGRGIDLPEEIRIDLIQTWNALNSSFSSRIMKLNPSKHTTLNDEMNKLHTQMEPLDNATENQVPQTQATPLKLRNIGNSCYLDAVLQAFACIDVARKDLCEPLKRDPKNPDEHLKKLSVHQELIQFLDVQKMSSESRFTQMEFILFLMEGPSLYRLRDAIFNSGLHPNLNPSLGMKDQHDAAYVVELFIDMFLPQYKFKWQEQSTTLDDAFPGIRFDGPVDPLSTLQVSIQNDEKNLEHMINCLLGKQNIINNRKFNPKKNAHVIDEEKAASALYKPKQEVGKYVQEYRLSELPPVLMIQIKRFNYFKTKLGDFEPVKNNSPVALPHDGIIDVSSYYDAEDGENPEAKYKIKSYVVHIGATSHGGHYVAYVEINGKYYLCDDNATQCYEEITKDEFEKNEKAYLIFLERV
jgi:hypothetical protein